jgi:ABC-type Fe3+ transport system permease subunit
VQERGTTQSAAAVAVAAVVVVVVKLAIVEFHKVHREASHCDKQW